MARSATATKEARLPVRRRPRYFYIAMGVAALLVVVAGFGGSFYGTVSGSAPLSLLVNIHAFVFAAWLVLFVAQTALVAAGKTAVHRRLGILGAVIASGVIVLGFLTAVAAARRGFDLPLDDSHDPLRFLVFTLGDTLGFAVLVAAGFWYRRRPEVHKRLMLLATVSPMMNAPIAHFFFHRPGLPARPLLFLLPMAALLFAGAVYDRVTLGRFHPVTLWGAVILFAWGNLRAVVIGPSAAWHEFAAWLIR